MVTPYEDTVVDLALGNELSWSLSTKVLATDHFDADFGRTSPPISHWDREAACMLA